MLTESLEFFKREKFYTVLFLALVAFYGFFLAKQPKKDKTDHEKPKVLQEFKQAENRVKEKVKSLGSVAAYLKDRPDLVAAVNLTSLIAILALAAGAMIDYFILFKPGFRQRFHLANGPPAAAMEWKFSMLFKFFIWFFALNIALGAALAGIQHFFEIKHNLFILLHTALAEVMAFMIIFWQVKSSRGSLASLGLWVPDGKWFREMKMGWMAYLAVIPVFGLVLVVLMIVIKILHYEPPAHPLVPIFLEEGRPSGTVFCSLALALFFGPLFEEIFFRGFCYPILKQRIGKLGGMIVTSAFFALVHDSTFAFWPIFILGLGLNYVYASRGSLLASMTLHITHNTIFIGYFFLAKDIIGRELGG